MIPPSFCHLGKKARDVIEDGFRHGFLDLELKTRSASGVEISSTGAASTVGDGAIDAQTQLKFVLPEYGLSFKEKWVAGKGPKYQEDTLKSDICWENGFTKGSKLTFESSFAPASMTRKEKLKATLKKEFYHLTSEVGLPPLRGSASLTVALRGFVLGYKTPLRLSAPSNVGDVVIGFVGDDVEVSTKVVDGGDRLCASLCHRVTNQLSTAFVTEWNRVDNESSFALGAEYILDDDASMKVKVDHLSRLGLSYSQTLKHGLKLSASTLVDGKNIGNGAHQIGLGIAFDLS